MNGDFMDKTKLTFVVVSGFIFSRMGVLALPMVILLILNLADYVTGLAAAKYREPDTDRPIKSYKSFRGILKKICMYILIMVGWAVDTMLSTTLEQAGFSFNWQPVFAIVITCWLIFNEIISLLENIDDIGTPIPPFLLPVMKMMREKITIESEGDEDEDQ